jgi:heme A synthase
LRIKPSDGETLTLLVDAVVGAVVGAVAVVAELPPPPPPLQAEIAMAMVATVKRLILALVEISIGNSPFLFLIDQF